MLNLLGRTVRRQPIDATAEDGVEFLVSTDDLLEARVRAGGAHRVRVGPAGGDWSCTCPRFGKEMACEHLLAVLRKATEGAEDEAAPAPEPPWLERLRRATHENPAAAVDVWGTADRSSERLVYLVRFDGGPTSARADLVVMLQRRLVSGEWSRPKPVRLRELAGAHPALEGEADRLLLALLPGLESTWVADWRTARGSDGAFKLDAERGPMVLAHAVRTGRLFLATAADMDPRPLADGQDRPWSLEAVAGAESRGSVTFEHRLRRGGESAGVAAVKVAYPSGTIVVGHELARLEPPSAVGLLRDVLRSGPIVVPASEAQRAGAELARRSTAHDDRQSLPLAAPPRPILRVERPEHRRNPARLDAHIHFDYGSRLVASSLGDPFVIAPSGDLVRRNLAAERARIDEFLAAGGMRVGTDPENDRDATVARASFEETAEALMDLGWAVEVDGRSLRRSSGTSVSVRSGVDWFDLEAGVAFGDQRVALPALLAAIETGSRFVALGDGSRGILPREWVESWRGAAMGRQAGDAVRFDRTTAWLLSALLEGREAEIDEPFRRLRDEVHRMQSPEPLPEPPGFRGELRGYQREGLGWLDLLDRLGLGGCLADEMGLGKTVQLLAHIARRVASGDAKAPSLVVAPRSLVFNWLGEARRFVPELRVADHTGIGRGAIPESGYDVVVTTYGTLRRDAPSLGDRQFDVVVLDEGQAIKNRASQTARAARLLRARQRVVLTGTPIENHLGELWSMMEFLNPGFATASSAFRKLGRTKTLRDLSDEQRELLARALRPFFLRRTKATVARELPPRTEQVIECELRDSQREEYAELRDYYRSALAGYTSVGVQVIQGLLRLRQLACHPGLIDKARAGERSAKLDTVMALLEDVVEGGNKALVFSQFTSFLAIVRAAVEARGWPYAYLDGQTRDREGAVRTFQEDAETPLFLVSLKAGGHGLNLTAADFVLLLDPWWNPAAEAQAIDRAHRIGRENPVHVYRLVARGTIEERVLELQASKRDLAAVVLGGATSTLSQLGPEELRFLLS